MKKPFLLLMLFLCFASLGVFAQRTGSLTINTQFTGILNGYDLNTKTAVYIDGDLVGETTEQLQSKPNSFSIHLKRGKHTIKLVNLARCNGKWEIHSYANNYSIDAFYQRKIKLKKELTINLLFDISKEKTFATLN